MQVTHVSRGLVLITVLFACALSAWAQMTYTVTPSACANGTISPNTAQLVNSGDALPFTATPTTGYGVNTWNVEPVFFSDPLDGTSLDSAWTTYQGAWSEHGVLSQTDSITHANTKKASVTNSGVSFPAGICVTAKIRVNAWAPGDGYCFAGVGLMNNPANGEGYDLVFSPLSPNTVSFLYDDIMWGNAFSFNWSPGTWYWFKEAYDASTSTVYGKVWADGTPEPTAWMFTQTGWGPLAYNFPCINGGGHGCTIDAGDFSVAAYGDPPAQIGGNTFTLSGITANYAVMVTFATTPVATDDAYTTNAGLELDVSAADGVLVNDTSPDGNALTAQLVSGPANGMLTLNTDGSFSYIPNGGFCGNDTFTYTALNGGAISNTATVTITVEGNYTVTPSAGAHGAISPNTVQPANTGDSLVFTGIPNTGYGVNAWYVEPVLFSDPLDGTSIGSAWSLYQGAWSENGMLSQTDSITPANTKKASVTNNGVTFPTSLCVTAKIRVDAWKNGDGFCFAGVGVMNDPATGEGYDLVFSPRPRIPSLSSTMMSPGAMPTLSTGPSVPGIGSKRPTTRRARRCTARYGPMARRNPPGGCSRRPGGLPWPIPTPASMAAGMGVRSMPATSRSRRMATHRRRSAAAPSR